ncbi:MAG: FG-GAP-like repeat-containing protein [Pseudomonadota bacterium]
MNQIDLNIGQKRPAWRTAFVDRRVPVALLVLIAFALIFWLGSRYPQLSEKALMGAATPISGLAFDIVYEVVPGSPYWWQITGNTLNWIYTNWKGMTFGVIFGAALLTLLSLIKRRSFDQPFADAALGAAIGSPLGVCVNCAAPIAQGLHSAGMRLETVLAALVASPTLNVIVVSMSFALFPFYMAATKLVVMLGFILIGIPLLAKYVFGKEAAIAGSSHLVDQLERKKGRIERWFERLNEKSADPLAGRSWATALWWLIRTFPRNLAFVALLTVPLMLVAGFLGAIMVTSFPFGYLNGLIKFADGIHYSLILMVGVTVLAILLPVPIAFDVILVAILMNSGWPARYVVPMLIALGAYSIYSWMIVGRAVSWRVSTVMMAAVAATAFSAGIFGHYAEQYIKGHGVQEAIDILNSYDPAKAPQLSRTPGKSLAALQPLIDQNRVQYQPFEGEVRFSGDGTIKVEVASHRPKTATMDGGGKQFTTVRGDTIGLTEKTKWSFNREFVPGNYVNGIAAADVHGDGWLDIAFASDPLVGGVSLYANIGGRFERQIIDLGPLEKSLVTVVALRDLNRDGAPDLFFSTYGDGTHIFWNRGGAFSYEDAVEVPNGNGYFISAVGFADLDADGNLDIVAGNGISNMVGSNTLKSDSTAQNNIIWNEGGRFSVQRLEGVAAETLTVLLHDINSDGRPDIMIGEDFTLADKAYLNQGNRSFGFVKKSDGIIPKLASTTMSFTPGDIDNDGAIDLFVGQETNQAFDAPESHRNWRTVCEQKVRLGVFPSASACLKNHALTENPLLAARWLDCHSLADEQKRAVCAWALFRGSELNSTEKTCHHFGKLPRSVQQQCAIPVHGQGIPTPDAFMAAQGYIMGTRIGNFVLKVSGDGTLQDVPGMLSSNSPGWSWNAQFVDFNQDGWQDLLVGTGFPFDHDEYYADAFYLNVRSGSQEKVRTLKLASQQFGVDHFDHTTSFLAIDFDRDGDPDVVRRPNDDLVYVSRNDLASSNALIIRFGAGFEAGKIVGAKVTLETSEGRQVRRLYASGGFASSMPLAAHFGTGNAKAKSLTVQFANGETVYLDASRLVGTEVKFNRP